MVIITFNDLLVKVLMAHNQKLLVMTDFKGYYYLINDTSHICSQFCRFPFYCFRILNPVITCEGNITKGDKIDTYFLAVLHFVSCQLTHIWIYVSPISIWFLIRNFICIEIAYWNFIFEKQGISNIFGKNW